MRASDWRIARRKLRTLAAAGGRRKFLVAEAVIRLASARIKLAVLPFRRIASRLGTLVPPGDPRILSHPMSHEAAATARDVGWAVRSVAPWLPFRSVCLQQALAAHAMLHRRGITAIMHFGTGRDEANALTPHAWLDAAGERVTGYPLDASMVEIGCFVEIGSE
jgi:hypothetical protein